MMPTIEDIAVALLRARAERRTTPALTPVDAEAAYAVQRSVARALGWFGPRTAAQHWKSGGASRDVPLTHAPLPPAGVWPSPALAEGTFQLRGIEAEVALRLGTDVDAAAAARIDHDSVPSIIDAMAVSIEIVDSRWDEGLAAPALARLADLQSHGALVLAAWRQFTPRDWSHQRCVVRIGAQPAAEFIGSHALGDPAFVLPQWLRHATRDGSVLLAGSVVTTGTWCGVLHAQAGDRVHVAFEGIGEADVHFTA